MSGLFSPITKQNISLWPKMCCLKGNIFKKCTHKGGYFRGRILRLRIIKENISFFAGQLVLME